MHGLPKECLVPFNRLLVIIIYGLLIRIAGYLPSSFLFRCFFDPESTKVGIKIFF